VEPPFGRIESSAVALTALAITVVITWPLVPQLNIGMYHPYDPPIQAWAIDWVQHALTSDARLYEANMFAPAGRSLTFSDALLGVAVPELLARPMGVEPIGMVNLAVILGVTANAWRRTGLVG